VGHQFFEVALGMLVMAGLVLLYVMLVQVVGTDLPSRGGGGEPGVRLGFSSGACYHSSMES
jgi:hypothetical protein